ncbi:MAG: hypothetical protein IPP82_00015 [Xanthomonadales bacterium]|nr:hypothetical protein [Xanthomonadales bacterium]
MRDEAIAARWFGNDVALIRAVFTKHAPQRRNILVEVVLFHDPTRPYRRDHFILAKHPFAALHQVQQRFECLGLQCYRRAIKTQQLALDRIEPEFAEGIDG